MTDGVTGNKTLARGHEGFDFVAHQMGRWFDRFLEHRLAAISDKSTTTRTLASPAYVFQEPQLMPWLSVENPAGVPG
jgi:hypothetical protein